jgi:hypothetical protein
MCHIKTDGKLMAFLLSYDIGTKPNGLWPHKKQNQAKEHQIERVKNL